MDPEVIVRVGFTELAHLPIHACGHTHVHTYTRAFIHGCTAVSRPSPKPLASQGRRGSVVG